MQGLNRLIEALPKAELHLHLEGTLEPEQMFALARRNDVSLPFRSVDAVRAAYSFTNLQSFLDLYYQGMSVLQSEEDFFDLTTAYLDRVAADNVRHVEVFFDPQAHVDRGLTFRTVIGGVIRGLKAGQDRHGISYKLIMCFLRHLSEEQAFATLKMSEPYLDLIDGVGLDSSETGNPPSKFKEVFAAARSHGLKCVAHAGEEGPAEYIWEAIRELKVDRIDHGNAALKDEALVRFLADNKTTLTLCPLSNYKLGVIEGLQQHPIKKLITAGVRVTINSDDPAYFGGYVNDNYRATAEALDLNREEIVLIAKNSFYGSFLGESDKRDFVQQIEAAATAAADVATS